MGNKLGSHVAPILVLAGKRSEYLQYCKYKGENPYTTTRFVDDSHPIVGLHFSELHITGSFYDWEDWHKRLALAKAALEPGGVVVHEKEWNVPKPYMAGAWNMTKAKPIKMTKAPNTGHLKPMQNGDVRKLPKANSPMWTEQWAAQGDAKAPYIVSKKTDGFNNAWACSCSDRKHMPYTDCKHICWVKKAEGIAMASPVAMLPKEQQEAFQAFLRQQAERGTPALPIEKSKPLFKQGRKFR